MDRYFNIFRLNENDRKILRDQGEIYPAAQLGYLTYKVGGQSHTERCLFSGGQIAVVFGDTLLDELRRFLHETWRNAQASQSDVVSRYVDWMNSLDEPDSIEVVDTSRDGFIPFLFANAPPPPPNRPTLVPRPPAAPPPAPPRAKPYQHLPFETEVLPNEVFYRWEPWPTSVRVVQETCEIAKETYASPIGEVPYIQLGFGAVARNALPSLFPAVFRHEIHPPAPTKMFCGAIVPSHGQSGGGVEVYFPEEFTNDGAIAKPVIIPPL